MIIIIIICLGMCLHATPTLCCTCTCSVEFWGVAISPTFHRMASRANVGNYDREKKALQQKKLREVILRAVADGHLEPLKEAIEVLARYFDDSQPHDGKQLLDFFPEKEEAVSTTLCIRSMLMNSQ